MVNNWKNFIESTKNRKPVAFLDFTIKKLNENNVNKFALDLGCGSGVDVKYLAENGFKVIAVDNDENAVLHTKEICKNLNAEVIKEDIFNFKIEPEKYSLIICWNSLPFLNKNKSIRVLENINNGLVKNGIFVFSIFGEKDGWNSNQSMSFWRLEEFKKNMKDFKFIELFEKLKEEAGATGEIKFWHLIQGITQK